MSSLSPLPFSSRSALMIEVLISASAASGSRLSRIMSPEMALLSNRAMESSRAVKEALSVNG
ncbi:hypothetical protein D3C81_2134320 [compost metagenome]